MGSDGGHKHRPGEHSRDVAERRSDANDPEFLPEASGSDRSWPLTEPMRFVRAERQSAAAQIGRSLRAWRKEAGSPTAGAQIPKSGGSALPNDVRKRMEGQLGADLSSVKVHTSSEAATAAASLGARAFTVGSDVHFGAGEYAPGTKEGDRLLAHELTHTVQGQKSGIQRKEEQPGESGPHAEGAEHGAVSHQNEPAEKEADAVADHVADKLHGGDGKAEHAGGEQGKKGGHPGADPHGAKAAAGRSGDGGKAHAAAHGADEKGGAGHDNEANASAGAAGAGAGSPSHAPAGTTADSKAQGAGADTKKDAPAGPVGEQSQATSHKAPPIAAKLDPNASRIFRALTKPNPPPPPPPGPTDKSSSTSSTSTDPYQGFCNRLPGDLKGQALALADPAQKDALQKVGLGAARAFFALKTPSCRLELAKLTPDQQGYMQTMALQADEVAIYEGLDAAKRPTWRDQFTPDERKDAKKLPQPALTKLMTVPAELQTWRVLRVKAVIGAEVSNKLTAAGENVEQIVDALSAGRGGDRLRRILMDPQLPPATKAQFMRDVKAKLPTAPDPFEAMKQCQPNYKLLGNDASKDGQFASMEILKAFPLVNFPKYGSVPPGKILEACKTAPDSDKRIPRKGGSIDLAQLTAKITTDKTLANQLANEYFPKYAREGGVGTLSGCDVDIVGGRGGLPAYWVYDAKAGMTIGKVAPEQVAHALAVDENPAYLTGGALVALPPALKTDFAARKQIKRPTAIDGLGFDQFQVVEDPSQCFGITAGGVGEVVVGPTKFSQTTPKKTF